MKTNTIILVGFLLLTKAGIADTLVISGTVPDRGFRMLESRAATQQIVPNHGSLVKVFIAELKTSKRSPQSVGSSSSPAGFSAVQDWQKLTNPRTLSASSYIKVEAP